MLPLEASPAAVWTKSGIILVLDQVSISYPSHAYCLPEIRPGVLGLRKLAPRPQET